MVLKTPNGNSWEIFNTTTATDQLRYASNQPPLNSDEERELENNFLNIGVHIGVDSDDNGINLKIDHEKSLEAFITSKEMYSIEECIRLVEEMVDIDNDTFNKMLEKIVLIEWRKIFVTMSDAMRKAGLASL
ncbi:PREDICTED: L10-interacting MYB domain-containing [Prunus dulcis]|uniref:PREDICTED: L10-interacting MYB domain-containing n=1 Tax=Prunus dulcis TaxID=3755 RepID=A0A5E4G484_PRUDU|nr:PREDICTED: L10-interacting MYB domain-containing [Prunus dulcis]